MIAKNVAPKDTYVDKLGCAMPQDTLLQRWLLVRYSSASRIVLDSMGCLLGGGAFGASLALFKKLPVTGFTIRYGLGALGIGLVFFSTNLTNSASKEFSLGFIPPANHNSNYFIANITGGLAAFLFTFAFHARRNPSKLSLSRIQAQKYVLPICTAALYTDVFILQSRTRMVPRNPIEEVVSVEPQEISFYQHTARKIFDFFKVESVQPIQTAPLSPGVQVKNERSMNMGPFRMGIVGVRQKQQEKPPAA